MHNNFKKQHKGKLLRDMMWNCATATTVEYFRKAMDVLKNESVNAFDWLATSVHPQHWARSHFSTVSKCDHLLNNHAESFNAFILEARDKPIITMLETIRNLLMDRIVRRRDIMLRLPGPNCPAVRQRLEKVIAESMTCRPRFNGVSSFQVSCSDGSQFTVNVRDRSCTCRKWDLTGIPCAHGVSAIHYNGGDPHMYVHDYFKRDKYLETYSHVLQPINGPDMWPQTGKIPLDPPIVHVQPGRPKKARKRDQHEPPKVEKLGKRRVKMTCTKCGNTGHNQRSCKRNTQQTAQAPHTQNTQAPQVPDQQGQ